MSSNEAAQQLCSIHAAAAPRPFFATIQSLTSFAFDSFLYSHFT
jgi:hypothetical protein